MLGDRARSRPTGSASQNIIKLQSHSHAKVCRQCPSIVGLDRCAPGTGLDHQKTSCKRNDLWIVPLQVCRAAAVATIAIPASMNDISDAERQALATELGYRKIGKELPDGVTLNDVVQSMPKEVGVRLDSMEFSGSQAILIPSLSFLRCLSSTTERLGGQC